MTHADEKRYRPHAFDDPHERSVSRRIKAKRHVRWRDLHGPLELGIEEVEYETISTWRYQYLTMGCGCRLTTSDLLRPGSIFGLWTEDCQVDPVLHELAVYVGLGDFPPEREER